MTKRHVHGLTTTAAILFAAIAAAEHVAAQTISKRPVVVEDMIRMTTILGDNPWDDGVARPAVFSHDRSRFAFVVERGDLSNNSLVSSLIVVRARDVFTAPKPDTLVTFVSTSSRRAIANVRWLSGDTAIAFIGERPKETAQLWLVNTRTRAVRALTKGKVPVTGFDLSPAGDRVLLTSGQEPDSAKMEERASRGFLVTQELRDLYAGALDVSPDESEPTERFVLSLRDGTRRKVAGVATGDCYGDARFASTGRYAIYRCIRRGDLADWKRYIPDGTPQWRMGSVEALIDLTSGRVNRLLDLPFVGRPPEWSPDGSVVLVTNTLLPLDRGNAGARVERGAVIVNPSTRAVIVLAHRDSLELARWSPDGRAVVLRSTTSDKAEIAFRRDGARWVASDAQSVAAAARPVPANGGLDVIIEQDLNTPPRIVAVKEGRRAVVFDPNPQFAQLAFGREEVFTWKTSDGEWEGGLYYPVGYTPGKRYPLVIQTHGFSRDRFQISGYGITGYAAQSLAGKGVMVLQVGDGPREASRKSIATPEENPFNLRGLEAAIDTLDTLGLIDANKVGLEGWSRTTLHVRYMLVNSKYPVAAALISDGYDASYARWVINHSAHTELEAITGGPPIGNQIAVFQERIPTMQPEKVKAPVLIEAIAYPGGGGPLTQWEFYQLLRRLNKPVELVYYPRGEHTLRMPWERLTSQGGAHDWFLFWLTGEEDPSPGKAEQYKRWREMRGTPR